MEKIKVEFTYFKTMFMSKYSYEKSTFTKEFKNQEDVLIFVYNYNMRSKGLIVDFKIT